MTERLKIKSDLLQDMVRPVKNNKKRLCSPDVDSKNYEENRMRIIDGIRNKSAGRIVNNIYGINENAENENNSKDPELKNIIDERKQSFLDRIKNIGKGMGNVEQNNKEIFQNKKEKENKDEKIKEDKNKKMPNVITYKDKIEEKPNLDNSNNMDCSKDGLNVKVENKLPEKLRGFFRKHKK